MCKPSILGLNPITHWTMLEDNDQIGEKSSKYGEKKIDKQVIGHLLVGLFNIGSLMETKSLE
jgi:hypothetical protein